MTWISVPDPFDERAGAMPVKLVVCGGYGAGKTTFVGAISEIVPITTEAPLTELSLGTDEGAVATKLATTVALDFGRISLDSGLVLYLFGTPGQSRFRFAWDEVTRGAIGAVILVDSRRIDDAFPSVDFCEAPRHPVRDRGQPLRRGTWPTSSRPSASAGAARRRAGARHRRPLPCRRQGHPHRPRAPRIARPSTYLRHQDGGVLPVVILHWNRPERCVGTVERFLAQDVPGGVRVVVVDNGSEPDARRDRAQGSARAASTLLELPAQPRVRPRRQRRASGTCSPTPSRATSDGSGSPPTTPSRRRAASARMLEVVGERPARRPGLRRLRRRRHARSSTRTSAASSRPPR